MFGDNKLIVRQQTLSQLSLVHASDKKLILLVFGFFFLINIVSSGGHLDWWDGVEAFLVTESMALKHTAKLDPSVPSVKELNFYVNYTLYANTAIQTGKYSNPQNVTLEPFYSPIILHTRALATEYVTTIVPEQYMNTSWYWVAYGNAPCKYDLYIYCNLGVVPFLVITTGIVIIAILIIARIGFFSALLHKMLATVRH
jgi:hypothetical protein